MEEKNLTGSVHFNSIAITIPMSEIYRNVVFGVEAQETA